MTRQATVDDVLELAAGRHHLGLVIHVPCGGQVVWSLYGQEARCRGCSDTWALKFIRAAKADLAKPSAGYLHWQVPMEIYEDC